MTNLTWIWIHLGSRSQLTILESVLTSLNFCKLDIQGINPNRDKQSFQKPGLDEDVVKLRYKHHRNRLFDTVNRVLEERNRVKQEMLTKNLNKLPT